MQSLRGWTMDDRRVLFRTIARSLVAIVLLTSGLMIGPLRVLLSPYFQEHGGRLMLFLYEIPQALGLAIPIGCMLGILYGMRDRPASRRSTAAILAFASVASLVAFATQAWMIPAGSRAYHTAFSIPQGTRGLNDFTLGELSRQIDSYRGTSLVQSSLLRDLTFAYQQKWALSGATVVLALFAVSMARWLSAGWLKPFLLAAAGLFGYYVLLFFGRAAALQGTLPVFAGVWIPNVFFLLLSAGLLRVAWQRSQTHWPA